MKWGGETSSTERQLQEAREATDGAVAGGSGRWVSGGCCVRSRQFWDRLNLVDMMDGVDCRRRQAQPAMKEMPSLSLAAVVDAMLRPHRILDQLDVGNVMDGLDYTLGCPPLMGLPVTKTMVAANVRVVETSSLLE
ncbi:hypothetical protein ACLOJK_036433 [Asimina triloba]